MNLLDQLKKMTVVVADTGDIESMKKYTPRDATTNPTLIFKASQMPQYKKLIEDAVNYSKKHETGAEKQLALCLDMLSVNFGKEILKIVPGRVSTEVDARLSFDTNATIEKAKKLIKLYEENGISKDRVLIKVAATWEGIRAAEILEKEGIHCNLTLIFSMAQAISCAEASVTLISPFVGRILDWNKKAQGVSEIAPSNDPGVKFVTGVFNYYKKFGYKVEIMGASFRNSGEIIELAGCDLLTISPNFLEELQNMQGDLVKKLDISKLPDDMKKIILDEKGFRWMLNEDAMATEKLSEGIRLFKQDTVKLENHIKENFFA
ncbi:MAG: transaldolase [Candidatus Wallbacteria bacterium]